MRPREGDTVLSAMWQAITPKTLECKKHGPYFVICASCLVEEESTWNICPRDDCQRDHHDCPDCYEYNKYKSPDIEED